MAIEQKQINKTVTLHDYKFIARDFNARLGMANENEYRIGKFGLGEGNENGIVSQDSCLQHVSSTEIHFSRRKNTAAEHVSHLTARHMRKLTIYLQTEDDACSTQL